MTDGVLRDHQLVAGMAHRIVGILESDGISGKISVVGQDAVVTADDSEIMVAISLQGDIRIDVGHMETDPDGRPGLAPSTNPSDYALAERIARLLAAQKIVAEYGTGIRAKPYRRGRS